MLSHSQLKYYSLYVAFIAANTRATTPKTHLRLFFSNETVSARSSGIINLSIHRGTV